MIKKLLIMAIAACMVGCTSTHKLQGGTVVTLDGDTIVFYGGVIPATFKNGGARVCIWDINVEKEKL